MAPRPAPPVATAQGLVPPGFAGDPLRDPGGRSFLLRRRSIDHDDLALRVVPDRAFDLYGLEKSGEQQQTVTRLHRINLRRPGRECKAPGKAGLGKSSAASYPGAPKMQRPPKKFHPHPFAYHQEIELRIDALSN